MKRIGLLLLLLSAHVTYAQVTYLSTSTAFPHIAIGGEAEGMNFVTLVQIVNNNSSFTNGHLTLFADDGTPLQGLFDGKGPQSTFDIQLASGESRQVEVTRNGGLLGGWMGITYSPGSALTTVILQFRSGTSLLSEVGVDPVVGAFAAIPTILSTDFAAETDGALNTGIAIANPTAATTNVLARLWDPTTGTLLANSLLTLPPNGHIARYVTDFFPTAPDIGRMRAVVSMDSCQTAACTNIGGNGFIATAVRQNADLFTTIPVLQRPEAAEPIDPNRILPQVAFGGPSAGLNMKTILYLTTNVSTGVFGKADIFDNEGNPLAASVDGAAPSSSFAFTVSGNRVSRVVLSGDAALRSGWIRLTNQSGSVNLIVNAVFQTFNGDRLVSEAGVRDSPAEVPDAPLPPVTRGLIYVKIQSGSNVGVAFANSQATTNTIAMKLFNQAGFVVATKDIILPPNGHLAQFLTDIFPEIASNTAFDGALFMRSTTAFSAMALRLSGDKIATLPVAANGMFLPHINTIRVPATMRSPAQVNFQVDVTDYDADIVVPSSTSVLGFVLLDFGSAVGFDTGSPSVPGTALLDQQIGTLSGSFQPPRVTTAVPAGTQATFYMLIYDSEGNASNMVSLPVRF